MVLQNLPALALAVLLVVELSRTGEVSPAMLYVAALALGIVGLAHAGWYMIRRPDGGLTGIGVGLGAVCAALAGSGWLAPMDESDLVAGALLLLAGDLSTTLSSDWRDDTWLLPSLALLLFLGVTSALTIAEREVIAHGSAVLAIALVAVSVVGRSSAVHVVRNPAGCFSPIEKWCANAGNTRDNATNFLHLPARCGL